MNMCVVVLDIYDRQHDEGMVSVNNYTVYQYMYAGIYYRILGIFRLIRVLNIQTIKTFGYAITCIV